MKKNRRKTFLVLANTNAEPIPKSVVRIRNKMATENSSFQTKTTTGTWIKAQIKLVDKFEKISFLVTPQTLLKRYPRNVTSSEKAVAKDSPKEARNGLSPI